MRISLGWQVVILELMIEVACMLAVFAIARMIYKFIIEDWPKYTEQRVRKQTIQNEKEILTEMGTTKKKLYDKAYKSQQLQKLTKATAKDLGEHLSKVYNETIGENDIFVQQVVLKKWTDTNLNCPEKGEPTELPTLQDLEGWLIVWKFTDANGTKLYQYHTTVDGMWIRCGEMKLPTKIHQNYKPSDK